MARVRCCTDMDKTVLTQNFDKRNWITVSSDEDWNFFWFVIDLSILTLQMNIIFSCRASVTTVRSLFNPSNDHPRLTDNQ
jgi:hypothetical protein